MREKEVDQQLETGRGTMTALEFLKSRKYGVEFRWMGRFYFGEFNYQKGRIAINLALFVVDTFIHEWMHKRFPRLAECQIKAKTDRYLSRMTLREINALYRALMREAVEPKMSYRRAKEVGQGQKRR